VARAAPNLMPGAEARRKPEKPDATPFTPARSADEATRYAEATLKVRQVDYKGKLTIANAVNAALHAAAERGLSPPLQIAVDVEYFRQSNPNAWAVYVPSVAVREGQYNQAIVLNPERDWEDLAHATKLRYAEGIFSTDHPQHVVFHELGHLAYHRHAPEAFSELGKHHKPTREKLRLFAEQVALIQGRVSKRAEKDYREFVAEVFCMKMTRKRIPRLVQALYNQLDGPPVKKG
jgi:hypothetical protein